MNFTKTILSGLREWIRSNFLSYKPQSLSVKNQEQVRINIGETEDKAMEIAAELNLIEPMVDDEGFILTDENNNILSN